MQDRTLYGVEQDEGAIKSISENVISYEIGLNLIPFGGRWSMNVYHLMDKGQRSMSELVHQYPSEWLEAELELSIRKRGERQY